MTALLKIKGRLDSLRITDEDAKSLKSLWLDVEGTPRNKLIDLGEWAGELRSILSIDIEENKEPSGGMAKAETEEKDYQAFLEAFKALSPEQKLEKKRYELIQFTFRRHYKFANAQVEPTSERIKQAEALVVKYFTDNPEAVSVPPEIFKPLLTP